MEVGRSANVGASHAAASSISATSSFFTLLTRALTGYAFRPSALARAIMASRSVPGVSRASHASKSAGAMMTGTLAYETEVAIDALWAPADLFLELETSGAPPMIEYRRGGQGRFWSSPGAPFWSGSPNGF